MNAPIKSPPKHFLDLSDHDGATLRAIIADARARKDARAGLPKRNFSPWLADRAAVGLERRRRGRPPAVAWINHVRVPSIISALLLVMFFPLVLRLSSGEYLADTGFTEQAYLYNWLAVSGILFAGSAILYLIRVVLSRSRRAA